MNGNLKLLVFLCWVHRMIESLSSERNSFMAMLDLSSALAVLGRPFPASAASSSTFQQNILPILTQYAAATAHITSIPTQCVSPHPYTSSFAHPHLSAAAQLAHLSSSAGAPHGGEAHHPHQHPTAAASSASTLSSHGSMSGSQGSLASASMHITASPVSSVATNTGADLAILSNALVAVENAWENVLRDDRSVLCARS